MLIDQIFFDDSFIGKGWHDEEKTLSELYGELSYRWMPSGEFASIEVDIPAKTNSVIFCSILSVVDKNILKVLKVKAGNICCDFCFSDSHPFGLGSLLEIFVPSSITSINTITFFVPFSVYPSKADKRALAMAFYELKVQLAAPENINKFLTVWER
jgi:hypothetical protein